MGGSSKSSNSTTWSTGTENTSPWDAQAGYIKNAFDKAQSAYNTTMQNGPYSGDFVAQGDDKNTAAYDQAFKFGTDATNNGYVQNLFNQANGWLNNGSDTMNFGVNGLKSLSGDQTQHIIDNAGKYADNRYISDAVKSAMFDANRNAAEGDVPNLYRAAAGYNALNSDRAALSQGVIDRGLAEKAANISADMRYSAYNSGLDRAAGEINNQRGVFNNLAGFGQSQAAMGAQGIQQGIDNQSRLNQMSAAGAEGLRSLRQADLDNGIAKYQAQTNFPWEALKNYYSVVGDKSWGGSRTWNSYGEENKKETSTASPLSTAGGILGSVGSLFSGGASSAASGLFSFL